MSPFDRGGNSSAACRVPSKTAKSWAPGRRDALAAWQRLGLFTELRLGGQVQHSKHKIYRLGAVGVLPGVPSDSANL